MEVRGVFYFKNYFGVLMDVYYLAILIIQALAVDHLLEMGIRLNCHICSEDKSHFMLSEHLICKKAFLSFPYLFSKGQRVDIHEKQVFYRTQVFFNKD